MGKFRLYPFDKNKYFYGKLLTVRDFKAEQDYNTGRARMINRMLFGTGVVSGLKTTMIDSHTLSVEPGLAIDNQGREIVIPRPLTEKLAMIDGFNTYKDARKLYLCLQYDETGSERIHAVTNEESGEAGMSDYNRIRETYQLKLLAEAEDAAGVPASIDRKQTSVYQDERIRITLSHPRWVNPGEVFCVEAELDKKQSDTAVSFELALKSDCLSQLTEGQDATVRFKEPEEDRSTFYRTRIWLTACGKVVENATFSLDAGASKLLVDGETCPLSSGPAFRFEITSDNIFDRAEAIRSGQTVDERIEEKDCENIYLARILLLKTEGVYHIMRVEPMPFGQFVYDTRTLFETLQTLTHREGFDLSTKVVLEETPPESRPQVDVRFDRTARSLNFDFKMPQNKLIYDNIVTGTWTFEVDENFKFGKNYLSEELVHGLGKGPAYVQVGLDESLESFDGDDAARVFYGSPEVFFKTELEPQHNAYAFGTVLYPNKGTFRIGMRLQAGRKGTQIRARWWAYRCLMDIQQTERIKIHLEPSEATLKRGETLKLSAKITGDSSYDVRWQLDEERFGSVDDLGEFKASGEVGTAVIRAISNVDPNVSGVAYITIQDTVLLDKMKASVKL